MQRLGILVGRRRTWPVLGQGFSNNYGHADDDEGDEHSPQYPPQQLALADEAAQVNILILLLGSDLRLQQPTLLCLVEILPAADRPGISVKVPALLVVGGFIAMDLQWPAPVVAGEHDWKEFSAQ